MAALGGGAGPSSCAPEPTEADHLCFQVFRFCVGGTVLGLTGLFTILTIAPLVVETAFHAPPSPPPTPSAPWTLWTEHDTSASRMILLISSTQALLIGACFLAYRWQSGQWRHAAAASKARRTEVRDRKRAKKAKSKSGGDATPPVVTGVPVEIAEGELRVPSEDTTNGS